MSETHLHLEHNPRTEERFILDLKYSTLSEVSDPVVFLGRHVSFADSKSYQGKVLNALRRWRSEAEADSQRFFISNMINPKILDESHEINITLRKLLRTAARIDAAWRWKRDGGAISDFKEQDITLEENAEDQYHRRVATARELQVAQAKGLTEGSHAIAAGLRFHPTVLSSSFTGNNTQAYDSKGTSSAQARTSSADQRGCAASSGSLRRRPRKSSS